MVFSAPQKNKINLSDYNFRRDIDNRLLMADLSIFEVDVLRELVNGPLKNSVSNISTQLETTEEETLKALEKLSQSSLFIRQSDNLTINKELRKYYESQIEKFDEDFKPDMDFLQDLLTKVPIHCLPLWYAIPKHSDDIFDSIIEKYLASPKIYSAYLEDLKFDNPILNEIKNEVYNSPNFKIPSSTLLKKFSISREELEEHLLLLEYSFVCCLSYNKKGKKWQEIISPFHEWHEYCLFLEKNRPETIGDEKNIQVKKVPVKQSDSSKLISSDWYTPRNIHEIERSLKRVANFGWIYLDDFLKGFTCSFSSRQSAKLVNKGRRWFYQLPVLTEEELEFTKAVIMDRLFEMGFIELGTHKKRICFKVTPLGKMSITQ